MSFIFD